MFVCVLVCVCLYAVVCLFAVCVCVCVVFVCASGDLLCLAESRLPSRLRRGSTCPGHWDDCGDRRAAVAQSHVLKPIQAGY